MFNFIFGNSFDIGHRFRKKQRSKLILNILVLYVDFQYYTRIYQYLDYNMGIKYWNEKIDLQIYFNI